MLMLNHHSCYLLFRSHDARYDGRLFIAVRSTGIYCRTICKVRAPKPENCEFFSHSASAREAGYRPCLKCRPDLAPGITGTSSMIESILRFIETALPRPQLTVAWLAAKTGYSNRQLQRLFVDNLGLTPVQYLRHRRLAAAQISYTAGLRELPKLAKASGYKSLRALKVYWQEPLLAGAAKVNQKNNKAGNAVLEFHLHYRPPLDWQQLCLFFAARAIPGVEYVDEKKLIYYRSFRIEKEVSDAGGAFWLSVSNNAVKNALTVSLPSSAAGYSWLVLQKLRQMFDLDADPEHIQQALGDVATARPGLRLPGCFDAFEMLCRAVLGQQITVAAARTLARRFAQRFGESIVCPQEQIQLVFPSAKLVAKLASEQIAELGIIRRRVTTIQILAAMLSRKELSFSNNSNIEALDAQLNAVSGIGPWTAQYILMRAMSWPDAFPPGDAGLRRALNSQNDRKIAQQFEQWRPWRSYAVMHLWASLNDVNKGE